MKQTFTLIILLCLTFNSYSQVLFSEDFNDVTLSNGAAMMPNGWITENKDGQTAINVPSNFPFNLAQYNTAAWAVTDFELGNNKAAISTGINGPIDDITDRWLISPKVSGITNETFLFWRGFTTDYNNKDKCDIWVTSTIAGATPTSADFLADPLQKLESIRMTPDEFTTYVADLGDFAGKDIYFAVQSKSFTPAKVILDNFVVKVAERDDLEIESLAMETYFLSGPNKVVANVMSVSPDPITSITMSYQVDGAGPIVTETFAVDLMDIVDREVIEFTEKANMDEGGHDVEVWIEKVNGNDDTVMENNSKTAFTSLMDDAPKKRILIQEYTGAWCGFCPDGTLILEELTKNDNRYVPVAIHTGDEMEIPDGATIADAATSSYPSASFDFTQFPGEGRVAISRGKWANKAPELKDDIVPVEVEIESHKYDRATRELEVTVKTNFIGATRDDLRLNVWLIEENVTGPVNETGSNGWNNANYDNNTPGHPFFGLGNYLAPDDFVHEHVLNASFTGAWGDEEIFPSTIAVGEEFTKTFKYTLPTATGAEQHWKEDDMHVVAFVSRHDVKVTKRKILNAVRGITFLTGIGNPLEELSGIQINPNPVSTTAIMEVNMTEAMDLNIRFFNQLGLEVLSPRQEYFAQGLTTVELAMDELPNGMYFVSLSDEKGGIHTERVMVQR